MVLTYPECEQIVKTLSVGFYAKRRIPIFMDKDAPCSYYSPMEDKIGISYNQIAEGVKNLPDTDSKESAVRASFYHEVSHAILTPKELDTSYKYNVFEDERIETLLKDFYLNVDFKKNILAINGGKVTSPTTADEAFYNIVRFRTGPSDLVEEVTTIIKAYSGCTRNSGYVWNYECAIEDFYDEVAKRYKSDKDSFSQQNEAGKGEGQKDQSESQSQSSEDSIPDQTAEPSSAIPQKSLISDEELKKIIEGSFDFNNEWDNNPMNPTALESTRKAIEILISNFNKKNTGGNGINSYSGVFNPRAVARKDYRYFERSLSTNGNNKFGTCHLNLMIDRSGSFHKSETLVNCLLKVLTDIEARNPNFKLDVYFIGEGIKKSNSIREREIKCNGGNSLELMEVKNTMNKAQLPNTYNYNIILFDGDAFSDNYGMALPEKQTIFAKFNCPNTTMITDFENSKYISSKFTTTKVIFTKRYTEELIDNIIKVLSIAFH